MHKGNSFFQRLFPLTSIFTSCLHPTVLHNFPSNSTIINSYVKRYPDIMKLNCCHKLLQVAGSNSKMWAVNKIYVKHFWRLKKIFLCLPVHIEFWNEAATLRNGIDTSLDICEENAFEESLSIKTPYWGC
jgi:hypothetical protein